MESTRFNVLTRTHLRPDKLRRALESILRQGYQNVVVHVSVDVPSEPGLKVIHEYKEKGLEIVVHHMKPLGYPACNQYLNLMGDNLSTGWVLVLDDDDEYRRDNVLKELNQIVLDIRPELIMARFMRGPEVIPSEGYWRSVPVFRHIGSPCVVVPVELFRRSPLAPVKGGDFNMISKAWELADKEKIAWIDEPIVRTQEGESRGRADIAKYDIIIPVFNQGELTRKCLETVRAQSRDYRLIVIDNGSNCAEASIWKPLLQQLPHRLIINAENEGFVKAVNQGLQVSIAPYIVLLNNDTEVPIEWLERLIEPFQSNARVGASGPLSSCTAQWQGREIRQPGWRVIPPNAMLSFFCVMFSREAIKETGLLDESFGIGLGDDDDYCRRLHAGGYDLALCSDVLILHHHRTTFKAMFSVPEIKAMQKKAMQILENKQ